MENQHVLIVEDDSLNAEMMRIICDFCNADVTIAENGEYGLDCIINGSYSLILLDLRLPYISGADIARAARNNDRTSLLPIIAMSADFDTSITQDALNAGCDYFFPKPINVREIQSLIQSLLKA